MNCRQGGEDPNGLPKLWEALNDTGLLGNIVNLRM